MKTNFKSTPSKKTFKNNPDPSNMNADELFEYIRNEIGMAMSSRSDSLKTDKNIKPKIPINNSMN